MTAKPLTLDEFDRGVVFWRTRDTWPCDFHNEAYQVWDRLNPNGDFTPAWWSGFLPRLQAWIATRPFSGAILTAHFMRQATELGEAWQKACVPYRERDITTVHWDQVKAFPIAVGKIKPTKTPSPVFTSKFCHFLLPRVFPVVDNEGLGNRWPTYEAYFGFVQQTWQATDPVTLGDLVVRMTTAVEATGREVFSGFPMVNKITELCLMGRHH